MDGCFLFLTALHQGIAEQFVCLRMFGLQRDGSVEVAQSSVDVMQGQAYFPSVVYGLEGSGAETYRFVQAGFRFVIILLII